MRIKEPLFHIVRMEFIEHLCKNDDIFIIPTVSHSFYNNPTKNIDDIRLSKHLFQRINSIKKFGISTSRGINFCNSFVSKGIIFELDKNKIQQRFKIKPIVWDFGDEDNDHKKELEEFIIFHSNKRTQAQTIIDNHRNFEMVAKLEKLMSILYEEKEIKEKIEDEHQYVKKIIEKIKNDIQSKKIKKEETLEEINNRNLKRIKERIKDGFYQPLVTYNVFSIDINKNNKTISLYDYFNNLNEFDYKENINKYLNIIENINKKIKDNHNNVFETVISEIENEVEYYLIRSNDKTLNDLTRFYTNNVEKGLSIKKYSNGYYLNKNIYDLYKIKDNKKAQKELLEIFKEYKDCGDHKYIPIKKLDEINNKVKEIMELNGLYDKSQYIPYINKFELDNNGCLFIPSINNTIDNINKIGIKFLGILEENDFGDVSLINTNKNKVINKENNQKINKKKMNM